MANNDTPVSRQPPEKTSWKEWLIEKTLQTRLSNLCVVSGVCLAVGGAIGLGGLVVGKDLSIGPVPFGGCIALFGFGGLLIGTGVFLYIWEKRVQSGAVRGSPDSADQGQWEGVLESAYTLAREIEAGRILRRNLRIRFVMADVQSSSVQAGRRAHAQVSLEVAYDVVNLGRDKVEVPLEASFEKGTCDRDPTKQGKVLWYRPDQTVPTEVILKFAEDAQGRMSRMGDFAITVEPNSSVHVRWTASYLVDLPHHEFWASTAPTQNMEIEVIGSLKDLVVSADLYRPKGQCSGPFVRTPTATSSRFEARGPFLPYQGMFIRLDERPVP